MHRRRLPLWLALLPPLGGCALGKNEFPAVCPQASLLPQAADLTRYRPGATGHDLTDVALQARIYKVDGKCEPGPKTSLLDATVTVTVEVTRGPGLQGRVVDIPYFVAVAHGDQILDKHVYSHRVTFPPNLDRVWLVGDPVDMRIPITPQVSGAAYTVWVGFQLSPQDLAAGG